MTIRIYNTLTRKKERFEPLQPGKVLLYVCGPTVYDDAHVGHAMSSVVFDVIRRYLEYRGYEVRHVMNYTDVDDKIILRANKLKADPFKLAEGYVQKYIDHLDDLNVLQAHVNPRATQEIDHIIEMNRTLIERGYAYPVNGDVYFRITRNEEYGKLSRRKLDELQTGARVEVDDRKENPLDFALWKAAKPGEPFWESPWGKGRPGWHIECSAMSLFHLGEQIDIHGGGNDLVFPHHENEIAQSEGFTGKPFARYWVHNGMLQLAGEKMSKSLGNLITIDEFLNKYDSDVFRLIVLNSSYRSPLTFNDEVIEQAKKARDRLRSALRPPWSGAESAPEGVRQTLTEQMNATQLGFVAAMNDDFNTASALGQLFDLVRAINQARDSGADSETLPAGQSLLRELAAVLGLRLEEDTEKQSPAEPFVDLLVEVRQELRSQKLWALADKVRDRLRDLGILIEDNKEGTTWRWE
ncbi:MAG: cysteine--tRNA ligase [Anaerolineales bacterium]